MWIKVVNVTLSYTFLLRMMDVSIIFLEISFFEREIVAPFLLKLSLKDARFILFRVLHTFVQGFILEGLSILESTAKFYPQTVYSVLLKMSCSPKICIE